METTQDIILTPSEKHILAKIARNQRYGRYDFWFIYDRAGGKAIDYEGGFNLPLNQQFRNQYSLECGELTKNW